MMTPSLPQSPRVDIFGVGITPVDLDRAGEAIDDWITGGARAYVCFVDVHSVMEARRNETLRRIHGEAMMLAAGEAPLVWFSRALGYRETGCVRPPDLLLSVCERSLTTGYSHFFHGAGPGVAERMAERLTKQFPGLSVAGTSSMPFREQTAPEREEMVAAINAARPDIVWVALGTPRQELWMAEHRPLLDASVLIGVGSAFDYHAGVKREAPAWMRRSGLEWVFRQVSELRRLWRRYRSVYPAFAWLALREAWRTSALRRSAVDGRLAEAGSESTRWP